MMNPRNTSTKHWPAPSRTDRRAVPRWLQWSYSAMVVVIVPIYWRDLGPANLLWFSDIALIVLAFALWLNSRFLASTMAVSVLLLELVWVLDFLTLGTLLGVAGYIFSPDTDAYLRFISALFHCAMPPVMVFMLIRFGYDRRALPAQILLSLLVIPLSYWLGDADSNINWSYGPGRPQELVHPLVYLGALTAAMTALIYLPSHRLFKRLFDTH